MRTDYFQQQLKESGHKTTLHSKLALSACSKPEKAVLTLIASQFAYIPFEERELLRAAGRKATGAEMRVGLILLRKKGIVYSLRKSWGERLYVLPFDAFLSALTEFWPEACTPPGSASDVRLEIKADGGIAFELFSFLTFVNKEEIALTQRGYVPKRLVQKWTDQTKLSDDDLAYLDFGVAETDYTKPFLFIYDLALRLGLVNAGEGRLKLAGDTLPAWLRLSFQEMNERLLDVWLEAHAPKGIPLAGVLGMALLHTREWISTGQLIQYAEPFGLSESAAEELELSLAKLLKHLAALGWGEIGFAEQLGSMWRSAVGQGAGVDEDTEQNGKCYVQPDFECIVPPDVRFDVRWELERFADHLHTDQVSLYRLDRSSITRALNNGMDGSRIIAFLHRHAAYGVPENIVQTINDWTDSYGRTAWEEPLLLRCADEHVADTLCGHPRIAPFIEERMGPVCLLIHRENRRKLSELLGQEGYAPRMISNLGTTGDNESAFASPSSDAPFSMKKTEGLFAPKLPIRLYTVDPDQPGVEELFRGSHQIPAMWLRECRSYHPSTRRQMLEKAIEWQTSIRLRQGERLVHFAPSTVSGQNQDWIVTGWIDGEEKRLSPDDWEDMQLILPGINEITK